MKLILGYDELLEKGYTDIRINYEGYDEGKSNFCERLEEEVQAYEKRYRTEIKTIGFIGILDLWNGNPVGGKMFFKTDNIFNHVGRDTDSIEIFIDEDNKCFVFHLHHHDGTHILRLYFITEGHEHRYSLIYYTANNIELIHEKMKPFKISKSTLAAYGVS